MASLKESLAGRGWKFWTGWVLILPFFCWAVFRGLGLERGYPFVQVVAYTPYVFVLSFLAFLIVVILRQWVAALVGLAVFVVLALAVLPRAIGGPDDVEGGRTVKIMSSNLLKSKADISQVEDLVRENDIDMLFLQEYLTKGLAEVRKSDIDEMLPYSAVTVTDENGGGAIYSRFPLKRVRNVVTGYRQPRAIVSPPGSVKFEAMSAHPMAPAGPSTTDEWNRDFGKLPHADVSGPPRLLAGDFNATLDHHNLRSLISTGYRDAGDVMGDGLIPTWPSKFRFPPPVTLDHVLAERPIGITDYGVQHIRGSDHRAIFATVVIPDS